MHQDAHPLSAGHLNVLREAGAQARDPGCPTRQRVTAALQAVECAVALNMYQDARQFALIAREQVQDREQEAQACHYLGVAVLEAEGADAAEGALLHALAMEDTEYVQRKRPTILYNLALVYQRQRNDVTAIDVYQQAAAAFGVAGEHRDAAHSYQNAAWLAMLNGQVEQAQTLLAQAAELTDGMVPGDRAQQQALEAYALCLAGDGAAAMQRVESVLNDGRTQATPWARCLALMAATELALAEGRGDLAVGLVRAAQEQVVHARNVRLMNLLTDLRRRATA